MPPRRFQRWLVSMGADEPSADDDFCAMKFPLRTPSRQCPPLSAFIGRYRGIHERRSIDAP